MPLIDIVKQNGKRPSEAFQHHKLKNSIYAVCISVHSPEGEASRIADSVTEYVSVWCSTKPAATSADLRRIAAKHLATFHHDAAHIYKHHKVIL